MEKVNIDALTSIAIYQSRDCSMENFYDAGTELPYQQWRNRVTYHSDDRNIKLPSCYAGTELLICQEGTVAYLRWRSGVLCQWNHVDYQCSIIEAIWIVQCDVCTSLQRCYCSPSSLSISLHQLAIDQPSSSCSISVEESTSKYSLEWRKLASIWHLLELQSKCRCPVVDVSHHVLTEEKNSTWRSLLQYASGLLNRRMFRPRRIAGLFTSATQVRWIDSPTRIIKSHVRVGVISSNHGIHRSSPSRL